MIININFFSYLGQQLNIIINNNNNNNNNIITNS